MRSLPGGPLKSLDCLLSTDQLPVAAEQAGVGAVGVMVTLRFPPGCTDRFRNWMHGPVNVPNVQTPIVALPGAGTLVVTFGNTAVGQNRFAEPIC